MSFVRHIQQQMRNNGLMVITMISPKTQKQKTEGIDGDYGNRPTAGSDESAENESMQTAVSLQQLACVQVVHVKAH